MNQETAEVLINQYKKATSRTRNVFVVLQLLSIIFVIGYFNHRFSWLRRNIAAYIDNYGGVPNNETNTVEHDMVFWKKAYANSKELNGDMKFIDFDLVGLEIYIEDLPLLGSIALTIILTWFFYVIRRESGIIKEIGRRTQGLDSKDMVDYMYYGTSFSLVFNTIKGVDEERISLSQLMAISIRRILIYLPVLVLTVILVHDVYETFWIDTPYGGTAWEYFKKMNNSGTGEIGGNIEIILRIALTLPMLAYCFSQCQAIIRFSRGDAKVWDQIQRKFDETR